MEKDNTNYFEWEEKVEKSDSDKLTKMFEYCFNRKPKIGEEIKVNDDIYVFRNYDDQTKPN